LAQTGARRDALRWGGSSAASLEGGSSLNDVSSLVSLILITSPYGLELHYKANPRNLRQRHLRHAGLPFVMEAGFP